MAASGSRATRARRALVGAAAVCALGSSALTQVQTGAQPPPDDAIGALLQAAPAASSPAPAPGERPVYVDEVGRTPDGPPSAADRRYEARVRASFDSAQGMQGPLDGHWTLSSGGEALYALQLVDKHGSSLEGAWRDVRRAGATEGSGFLSEIDRSGSTLTFRFQPRIGGPTLTATLAPAADGSWTGQLSDGAKTRPVEMRRD
ncbi:hypothetical protein [Phenylobacterium sp.]|uniref:hypothetical protein n=1 Tax=Phenylobacterium sp. TaxID=1871053 RepID=UPI0035B3F90B